MSDWNTTDATLRLTGPDGVRDRLAAQVTGARDTAAGVTIELSAGTIGSIVAVASVHATELDGFTIEFRDERRRDLQAIARAWAPMALRQAGRIEVAKTECGVACSVSGRGVRSTDLPMLAALVRLLHDPSDLLTQVPQFPSLAKTDEHGATAATPSHTPLRGSDSVFAEHGGSVSELTSFEIDLLTLELGGVVLIEWLGPDALATLQRELIGDPDDPKASGSEKPSPPTPLSSADEPRDIPGDWKDPALTPPGDGAAAEGAEALEAVASEGEEPCRATVQFIDKDDPDKFRECLPMVAPRPIIQWTSPTPRDGTEITAGLNARNGDGTPPAVEIDVKVEGRVLDLTREIVAATAIVTKSGARTGQRSTESGPHNANVAAFPNFAFNAIPIKGHGIHRIEVTILNAAGYSSTRSLEVNVVRSPTRKQEIATKLAALEALNTAFVATLKQPRFKTDTTGALQDQAYATHATQVAAIEVQLQTLDDQSYNEPAIRVWDGVLSRATLAGLDSCYWQAHIIDEDAGGARIRAEVRGSDSREQVRLDAYAPTRFKSDEPEYHFLIPPYQGAQGEYQNPDLKGPEAIQHASDEEVLILYKPGCDAVAVPIIVEARAEPWGYCGEGGGNPGELLLEAQGTPGSCEVGGRPVQGRYQWSLVEAPGGVPTPQFENEFSQNTKIRTFAPGVYRVRVQYGVGTICPYVQAEVTFEIFETQVVLDVADMETREEGTANEHFVISADVGRTKITVEILASDYVGDYFRIAGQASIELTSTGHGTLASSPPVTDVNGEAEGALVIPTRVPKQFVVKVEVTELPVPSGGIRDVRLMNVEDDREFELVSGEIKEPLTIEAEVNGNWTTVGSASAATERLIPAATGLNLAGLPRTSDQTVKLRFLGKDQHLNLLEDGTPVEWRLDGTGQLIYLGSSMATRQGISEARLKSGFLGSPMASGGRGADQLLRITVGPKIFWLGNPLIGAVVRVSFVGLDPSGRIRRDPQNRTLVRALVTVNGQPLAGGQVAFSISKGSVSGDAPALFAATCIATTNGQGVATARIHDRYHATDGTLNRIKPVAWGQVKITATVGQNTTHLASANTASGALTGRFNDADLVSRPRNIWPTGHILQQANYRTAVGPFGVQTGNQAPALRIQGTAGEEVRAEIEQDRRLAQIVRFALNNPDANDNLPGVTNASIHPRPILVDMKTRYFRAGWDIYPMGTTGAIEIEPSIVMSGLARAGHRHNIPVPGLTNFAISFRYWASSGSADQYIFEGWGSSRSTSRGWWDIEQKRIPGGLLVRGRFKGGACQSRNAARADTGWLPIRSGRWHQISFTVSGDPFADDVQLELSVDGTTASATTGTNSFNWLDGDTQTIEFGLPVGGKYWVHDLQIFGEINTKMNFLRPDGILTTSLVAAMPAGGTVNARMSDRQVREAEGGAVLQPPTYPSNPLQAASVVEFGRVGSTYCSTWDFDTEVIPALSPNAIKVWRESSSLAYGFVFGTGSGASGFAGDLIAGMVFVGDLRDIVKNLCYIPEGGEDPDWVEFGIALCGLILDVGEIFSGGADTPVNFFVACVKSLYKKMKALRTNANAHIIKRVGALLAEIVLVLIRDYRKGLITTQLSLVGWTLWTALKPLWDFFSTGITIPSSPTNWMQWALTVTELNNRFDLLLEIILNSSVKATADLAEICKSLAEFMAKNGMNAAAMRRFLLEQKNSGVTTDALRGALRALQRRSHFAGLTTADFPPAALRGLVKVALSHGAHAAYKVMRIHRDADKLRLLLTHIDSADRVLRRIDPTNATRTFDKLLGRLLKPDKANVRGVLHELAIFHRYRSFIRHFQTTFNDLQEGADFLIEIVPGKFMWLEAKALYSFTSKGIKSARARIAKQLRRFVKEAPSQVLGHNTSTFGILYVFRGGRTRGGSEFEAAVHSTVRLLIKEQKLPANFKPSIKFLGLPRQV